MRTLVLGLILLAQTAAAGPKTLPADSLYHLKSSWQTHDAHPFEFKEWSGGPVILAMAYTGCTYSCPMIIARLKELERALKAAGVPKYKIVLASFDTAGDRPAQLVKYMKDKELDPSVWMWLSTKKEKSVRELAAVLGVTYSKDGKGGFAHSNVITLLDDEGRIRVQLNGLNADHKPLVEALQVQKQAGL